VRPVSPREGRRLIDLTLEAMVTRERDLDAFSNADERDVRVVDYANGYRFACIGVRPERRLLLESVYGYLTLKNGVPIGYVLSASLFNSAEIAYNVFDTFRGAEAGVVYGHVLSMVHHLFGADAFTIPPYQLGQGNVEALKSGAWWFYQKTGFLPRDRGASALMKRELLRIRKRPEHRSSVATLERLSSANLYFHFRGARRDVMGELALPNVGLHVTRYLVQRFGSDREQATEVCARDAAQVLGVEADAPWSDDERRAWEWWSPVVMVLPGVAKWSAAERRALAQVIRLKGGRRESDFVRAFDAHAKLRRTIVRLAAEEPKA
jgi:hypothetical protein